MTLKKSGHIVNEHSRTAEQLRQEARHFLWESQTLSEATMK